MKASKKCYDLIKQFEGFSAKPYLCPAQVWTIGYGSTRYEDGRYVTAKDPNIDEARAIAIMQVTLKEYENAVNRYVKVPINQNQFE